MDGKIIVKSIYKYLTIAGALTFVDFTLSLSEEKSCRQPKADDKISVQILYRICEKKRSFNNMNKRIVRTTIEKVKARDFKSLFIASKFSRVQSDTRNRFQDYTPGFDLSIANKDAQSKGFLLLSRVDPETSQPLLSLIDLATKNQIYKWNISIEDLSKNINIPSSVIGALRFLHPLLLEDGSLITHIQPEHNEFGKTQLLKFDSCGTLVKSISDGYGFHHSIMSDENGKIYVPVADTRIESEFYSNYKDFPLGHRAKEGIAVLDSDLNILDIIELDKIYNQAGLLEDVNNPDWKWSNDPYHLNDVHPYINDKGETVLLLSTRHHGLASFNYSKNKTMWVVKGSTGLQHDISPIPGRSNTFSIFNNEGDKRNAINQSNGNTITILTVNPNSLDDPPLIHLGKKSTKDIQISTIDFNKVPENLRPRSWTEGRARFIDQQTLFFEETNHGRAFVYNTKTKAFDWNYLNTNKLGVASFLGWSRFIEELPFKRSMLNTSTACTIHKS